MLSTDKRCYYAKRRILNLVYNNFNNPQLFLSSDETLSGGQGYGITVQLDFLHPKHPKTAKTYRYFKCVYWHLILRIHWWSTDICWWVVNRVGLGWAPEGHLCWGNRWLWRILVVTMDEVGRKEHRNNERQQNSPSNHSFAHVITQWLCR